MFIVYSWFTNGSYVDKYPLSRPENIFATFAGGKRFTKLHLSHAYNQLTLDEESRKYVVVNTHHGLYRYTRLPFGIASAPAIFQRVMDQILQGMEKVTCYLDDILITGNSDEEHLMNLSEVLQRLQNHGVHLKLEKCPFMEDSVEYLGHQVDSKWLHTTDSKLKAIVDAPLPRNAQGFWRFLNYYGQFIPNWGSLTQTLNSLLCKDAQWKWTKDCAKAFQHIKDVLVSFTFVIHYDPTLPIRLAADASAYNLKAVISHVMDRNILFPSHHVCCLWVSRTTLK